MTLNGSDHTIGDLVLLDDDELTLELFARRHRKYCRSLVCFSEPEEAMHYMVTHSVDLLLLDYRMPQMSGVQFLHSLRQQIPGLACQICIWTAGPLTSGEEQQANTLGARTVDKQRVMRGPLESVL